MTLKPTIAVLGASGLIGEAVTRALLAEGFPVIAVARSFTTAQPFAFGQATTLCPVVGLNQQALTSRVAEWQADVVVNCIGVLQNGPKGAPDEVHGQFIARLLKALDARIEPSLLMHISVPGRSEDDDTDFSRTKHAADEQIADGPVPFVILRPGFVVAPAAYGGSALIRALAALPLGLPATEAHRPFAATDVADVARTISHVAMRWHGGERTWHAVWDVMERSPGTVGSVVETFRRHIGGPKAIATLPSWMMRLGALAGDTVAWLGWAPPIRSTALAEMRRGVEGNPADWMAATGIEPASLTEAVSRLDANVQAAWFGRLYLLKALVFGTLALFWIASGLIALTLSFGAAASVFASAGFPFWLAAAVVTVTSLMDIAIGAAIAWRPWTRFGLLAGIALAMAYLAGSFLIIPHLWLDPVGPLIKTIPAVVLMMVALAIRSER